MERDRIRYPSLGTQRLHPWTIRAFLFLICTVLVFLASCSGTPTQEHDESNINLVATEMVSATKPVVPSTTASGNENIGFSIYVVQHDSSAAELPADLDALSLEILPILSTDDIVEYSWQRHEMTLTPSASIRLERLQGQALSNPGLAFVVCVGSERIYQGAFWSSYSSVPFDGIVIDLYPTEKEQPIRIQTGYPTEEWFKGEDLRTDSRIFQSLKSSNKLK